MEGQPETKYGWFSRKQAAVCATPHTVYWGNSNGTYTPLPGERGPSIYRGADGSEVMLTDIRRTPEGRPNWDDAVYVGEVTTHIRNLPAEEWR